MYTISIIIPTYNHAELLHARLFEIYRNVFKAYPLELILIDDCSSFRDVAGISAFWQKNHRYNVRYSRNKENRGFGWSMNKGAELARGDVLMFLSNDVVVSGDFVEPVIAEIEKNERSLIGARMIDWSAGWNEVEYLGKPMIVPYLEGWFLACTRSVWKELGGFDLRYGKYDYEDVDLSTTAHLLGINLVALPNLPLRHIGAQTIKFENRMVHTQHNRQLWLEKWQDHWDEFFKEVYDIIMLPE